MKTCSRHQALLISCITALGVQIGCDTGAVITVSDVPCFQPIAWSPGGGGMLIRTMPDVEGAILITRQTSAQIDVDRNDGDGMLTFLPHDSVYSFSPETGVTDLVDDSDWDKLTTRISDCLAPPGSDEPFGLRGGSRPSLRFEDGEMIPVAGGAAVRIESAPFSAVAAVVSTSGSFPIIPFTFGTSTGQHYHQLFSRLDGSPIGKAVRLGVGLSDLCWTFEEEYVVYMGFNSNSESTICIVPIEDELPQFGN